MKYPIRIFVAAFAALVLLVSVAGLRALSSQAATQSGTHTLAAEACTVARLGASIPISSIGEPRT